MKSNATKPTKVYATEQTLEFLDRFARVGVFGNSVPAVIDTLLTQRIVQLVTDGTLEKLESQTKVKQTFQR